MAKDYFEIVESLFAKHFLVLPPGLELHHGCGVQTMWVDGCQDRDVRSMLLEKEKPAELGNADGIGLHAVCHAQLVQLGVVGVVHCGLVESKQGTA